MKVIKFQVKMEFEDHAEAQDFFNELTNPANNKEEVFIDYATSVVETFTIEGTPTIEDSNTPPKEK